MRLRSFVYGLLLLALLAERPSDHTYSDLWQTWLTPVGSFFFTSLPGIRLPLWHLLVVVLLLFVTARRAAHRGRARPLDRAIQLSYLGLAVTVVWGAVRGGSVYQSYFQIREFVFALLFAQLLLGVLRTPKDIAGLGQTVLFASLTRACLAVYVYVAYVIPLNPNPYPAYMTTHDDTVLFVLGIMIVLSRAITGPSGRAWAKAAACSSLILYAIYLNQRRLAWVSLAVAVAATYFLISPRARRPVHRWAVVLGPIVALYVIVGWGRQGALFAPLQSFSSVSGEEDDSTLAREIENEGLIYTYAQHPLLGTGWGHEYTETSTVYSQGMMTFFPQYRYIPHNSLVAILAFAGTLGFAAIELVFPVAVFLAGRTALKARGRSVRANAMWAAAGVIVYLNQAYGDMGFQSIPSSVLVAGCLAAAGRLAPYSGAWPGTRRPGGRRAGRPSPRPELPAGLPAPLAP